MGTRVGIYARQSVRADEGIAQQLEKCKARAVAEGWEVAAEYIDNDVSATKARGDGTEWARMLADIDAGKLEVILATTTARLLRRTLDVIEVTPPRRAVRVVTVRDGIDTGGTFGKAILTILVALAEAEIEEKEARRKPYAENRRAAGHPTPGLVPFGYRWVPKLRRDAQETRFEIVPAEAEIVRRMFRECIAGLSLKAICRGLNADGLTTRRGARWGVSTVRRLLMNPFLAAQLPPKQDGPYRPEAVDMEACIPGLWQPIVSRDEVMAARHLMMSPGRLTHSGTQRKHLVTGIARCSCGSGIKSAVSKERYPAYRCLRGCFQRRGDVIDAYVVEAVVGALSDPGRLVVIQGDVEDVAALRVSLAALEGKRVRARMLWRSEDFSNEDYQEEVALIEAQVSDLEGRISAAVKADPLSGLLWADDVRALWDGLPLARRQIVIRELFETIEIQPVGKGVRATMDAPRVRLIWRSLVAHKYSISTRKPFAVPQLDARQGAVIAAALST